MGRNNTCRDHLGNEYPSVPDMCQAYGIPPSTYANRLSRGWTIEQALTVPTNGNGPKVNPRRTRKAVDHLGQEFVSISEMCRHWGLDEKVYWSRRRIMKWPLEKILTEQVRNPRDTANAVHATDHEGRTFRSISEMCRHWKIGLSTYRERRKRGWNVERALTGKETNINTDAVPCTDHLGNKYPSKNAMCRAYGITRYCYESRIGLGWTQADALTQRHVINAKPCQDHTGKQFPASVYMALYLGFPGYVFHNQDDPAGLVPKLAATYWRGRNAGKYHIKNCVAFPWFLAESDGQPMVIGFDRLLEAYHEDGFMPLPVQKIKNPYLYVIKQVRWPWYLCSLDGSHVVLDYDRLIQLHRDCNYGLSAPDGT